jgi:hypothetical protein
MTRFGVRPLLLAVAAACAPACEAKSSVTISTSCLDACRGTLKDAELSAQLDASADLQAGFSALVAGGSAYASVASSLSGFVRALVENHAGRPGGISFVPGGGYAAAPSADVHVDVKPFLATATSFGKPGDALAFDILDPASYFEGFTVKVTGSIGTGGISTGYEIDFTKAGPGVELLGIGASPKSPISVDIDAWQAKLSATELASTIVVDRTAGASTVHMQVRPPRAAAGSVGGSYFPLTLENWSGSRTAFGQTVNLAQSQVSFTNGVRQLDGTILTSSVSPTFSFQMLFSFPNSVLPDIVFGCPGVSLAPP